MINMLAKLPAVLTGVTRCCHGADSLKANRNGQASLINPAPPLRPGPP